MTVTEMYEKVNFNIRAIYSDQIFLDTVILAELNTELAEVAGDYCIPKCKKTKTVTFEADEDSITGYEAKVRVPTNFDHDLFDVWNETQDSRVTIYPNVAALYKEYDGCTLSGSVAGIAHDDDYLWALLCPETEEDVTIQYYGTPDTLSEDEDEPDCLPTRLHEGILVNGATARLLGKIKAEIDAGNKNVNKYLADRLVAVARLAEHCKQSPRSKPYRNRRIQYF